MALPASTAFFRQSNIMERHTYKTPMLKKVNTHIPCLPG